MPSDFAQMVLAVVNETRLGIDITIGARSFWSRFGLPDAQTRQDAIDRAEAIVEGSEELGSALASGDIAGQRAPLEDIYDSLGYGASGTGFGPLDTDNPRLYVPIKMRKGKRGIAIRGLSIELSWGMTGDAIIAELDAMAAALARKYGFRLMGILYDSAKLY
jgi:hypothetical protein